MMLSAMVEANAFLSELVVATTAQQRRQVNCCSFPTQEELSRAATLKLDRQLAAFLAPPGTEPATKHAGGPA